MSGNTKANGHNSIALSSLSWRQVGPFASGYFYYFAYAPALGHCLAPGRVDPG